LGSSIRVSDSYAAREHFVSEVDMLRVEKMGKHKDLSNTDNSQKKARWLCYNISTIPALVDHQKWSKEGNVSKQRRVV